MATEEYIDAEIDPNTGLATVTEAKVVSAPLDSFADVIQEKFQRHGNIDVTMKYTGTRRIMRIVASTLRPLARALSLLRRGASLSTRPAGKSTQPR